MKAILMSFGYIVSGPRTSRWVPDAAQVEAVIEGLSESEGYDTDDYTATEVFAKSWQGQPLEHKVGIDWDATYKAQP